jgi:putative ABC transport system substrate-binding protein
MQLKRREFITLLGSVAVAWPVPARAQPRGLPLVGFLSAASPGDWTHLVAAFGRGLADFGYSDGQNVTIEYRWAQGHFDRLSALAADLVQRGAAVILAGGGNVTAMRAKAATSTIPIVFVMGNDPVEGGVVPNLNRPGGNITGITLFSAELGDKRVELLRELSPGTAVIGLLENPRNPNLPAMMQSMRDAAQAGGQRLVTVHASSHSELETAFATLVKEQVGGLLVSPDPFYNSNRSHLVSLSARHRIPTIYSLRDYVLAGGLISYGSSFTGGYRQAGVYVGRILNGEKPGDLPVQQPSTFELALNLKTAKTLGLTVPLTLQVRADEVIE